ncbi:hypothetical protein WN72_08270 [Bradyrhizobium arachidis]|uniref:VWFD domain-containing protein n=2 Tax=Bradyrhizobium arachidis TaxID=858423 RepID=A0AAE7TFM9_9BRAD|nr:hypothetical protein WN72_08270 [Bradyrhizobium arachidis]
MAFVTTDSVVSAGAGEDHHHIVIKNIATGAVAFLADVGTDIPQLKISADGLEVEFWTKNQLVSSDTDTFNDAYVARLAAPEITIDTVSGDNYVNQTEDLSPVKVTGTSDAIGKTVHITSPNGSTATAVVQADGTWTAFIDATRVAEGFRNFTADVADDFGLHGTATKSVDFDYTPPTLGLFAVAGDNIVSRREKTAITFDGFSDAIGQQVSLSIDHKLIGKVQVAPDGKWSFVYNGTNMADGQHEVEYSVADAAGNLAEHAIFFDKVTPHNAAPTFFVGGGVVITPVSETQPESVSGLAIQADGKIVVGGSEGSDLYSMVAVRYGTDGKLDASFGNGGIVTGQLGAAFSVAVQPDGKTILGGGTAIATNFQLQRFNIDGTPDLDFGDNGLVETSIETSAGALSIVLDGTKIIAVGQAAMAPTYDYDFALVRYLADGSLDPTFGNGGIVTTDFGTQFGQAEVATSVVVQSDGKIVVGGETGNGFEGSFTLARYNDNGTLDASFGAGGKVVTDLASRGASVGQIQLQADGKILVAGGSYDGSRYDFEVARYNTNGTLDTSFDGDGKVRTSLVSGDDRATGVVIQSDGKIIVAGWALISEQDARAAHEFALARYNANGSLDTTFGDAGVVLTEIGLWSEGMGVKLQADGKIVIAGTTINVEGTSRDFAVARYNPDGSLDPTFGGTDTLGNEVSYTEGGSAIVLDAAAKILDPELAALIGGAGNYGGASVTLARSGGANAEDLFGASGDLTLVGSNVKFAGITVGSFTQSAGQLAITFGAGTSQAQVNGVLEAITYANGAHGFAPGTMVQIAWTFSDGNTGGQGVGGAGTTAGMTTVDLIPETKLRVALATDSGRVDHDGFTNVSTVNVWGLTPGATWSYSTDGGTSFTPGTGTSFTLTGDGPKNVLVQEIAPGDVISTATLAFTLDTQAPDTTITAKPPALVNVNSASFGWSGTDAAGGSGVVDYQYLLDNGSWTSANSASSLMFTNLSDGSHSLKVEAIDAAGNIDPTPASYDWTVDTKASDVTVTTDTKASTLTGINLHNLVVNAGATLTIDAALPPKVAGGSIVNNGTILVNGQALPQGLITTLDYTQAADATLQATGGAAVTIVDTTTSPFTNLAANGTLTGGIYVAQGQDAAKHGSTITIAGDAAVPITTLSGGAKVVLDGEGTDLRSAGLSLLASLATLQAGTELDLVGRVDTIAQALTNGGTIAAGAGEVLTLTGTLGGTGTLKIDAGATLIDDGSIGAGATLSLAAPDGTHAGAAIDLTEAELATLFQTDVGAVAPSSISADIIGGKLVVHADASAATVASVTALPAGDVLTVTPDGHGGVNIAVAAAPTVTINQAAGQADPVDGSPLLFDVVFSEAVTDFTAEDVTLSGTAGATGVVVAGSGTTYTVGVFGMTQHGTVVASIAAGVAHDAANIVNLASTSTDNTVQFTGEPPVVHLTSTSVTATMGLPGNLGGTFSVTDPDSTRVDVILQSSDGVNRLIDYGSEAGHPAVVTIGPDDSILAASGLVAGEALELFGTIEEVNTALALLEYDTSKIGTDTITAVAVDDAGNLSAPQHIAVTVNPNLDQAPSVHLTSSTLTETTGTAAPLAGITVTDPDSDVVTVWVESSHGLDLTATPSSPLTIVGSAFFQETIDGVFVGGMGSGLTISGHLADVNATLASLQYRPGSAGTDTIFVLADDGLGGKSLERIAVTITAPTELVIPAGGTLTVAAGQTLQTHSLTIGAGATLHIDGTLVIQDGGASGTVSNSGTIEVAPGATFSDDLQNLAGASFSNSGATSDTVALNAGTITNTATGIWTGDVAAGANGVGGDIINQGIWNGTAHNDGGTIENAGTWNGAIIDTAGTFTNTGSINGSITIGGAATFALTGLGSLTNASPVTDGGTLDISGLSATVSHIVDLAGSGGVTLGAKVLSLDDEVSHFTGTFTGAAGSGLLVSGANIDLSGAHFTGWNAGQAVSLTGTGNAATLIGSIVDDHIAIQTGDGIHDLTHTIDGGGGTNTLELSGKLSDYALSNIVDAGHFTITDHVVGRDGVDRLSNIQFIRFDGDDGKLVATADLADRLPIAGSDHVTAQEHTPLVISAATLLANDNDPDGDTLNLLSVGHATHGNVVFDATHQTVTFTPVAGYSGSAAFDYTVSDGHGGLATGTVDVTVKPGSTGGGWGDVHYTSFDGFKFDLQSTGDYIIAHATSGPEFEIEGRAENLGHIGVSYLTAIAVEAGDHFILFDEAKPSIMLIDGHAVAFAVGDRLDLGDGVVIGRASANTHQIETSLDFVQMTDHGRYLDLSVHAGAGRGAHSFEGLLGNFDGNAKNDFDLRNGTWLVNPNTHQIEGQFADAWRVGKDSLLASLGDETVAQRVTDAAHTPAISVHDWHLI